jgi:RNA polymerase sigma factor (TIGR02999 family)
MSNSDPVNRGEMTLLLQNAARGDTAAAERILPIVYDELRKLAAAKMARESGGQTLQPTALVHEAWLRLGADQQPAWESRAQFFAAAAEAMRRILIENARRRRAARHGGGLERASPADELNQVASLQADDELLAVHDALDALAQHDPRKAELVKLRYFVGLELSEIAQVMGVSERTVNRDWGYARAWLFNAIKQARL